MESGIAVNNHLHEHKLYCHEENELLWYCDSLINIEECKGNQEEVCANYPCKKFTCKEGCVDLFCESCVDFYQLPENPIIEIKLKNHEHPLIFFECLPIKWACAYGENLKCKRNHNKEKDYRNTSAFACKKCQLYVCDIDARPFAKKEDLPRIKKSPTLIEKKVTFHEHPLRLSTENDDLWYCDCLTLDRPCESGQEEMMSDWDGKKKYICNEGCPDTFCELCVFKNMINEDENIKLKNPNHKHELKYYSNLPYEWCCEFGKSNKCLRNIKKADYWTHNVYVCEQCKFHICDLDVENEEIIVQELKPFLPIFKNNETIFNKSHIIEKPEQPPKPYIETRYVGIDRLKEKYDFEGFLGKGQFGDVFAIRKRKEKGDKKLYALKLVQLREGNEGLDDAKKEIENMEKLKNLNNILSIIDHQTHEVKLKAENSNSETKFFLLEILMELADGSLEDILKDFGSIEEDVLRRMFKQLVHGLWEAFNRNCGHLDIKPQNILAFGNILKLADWGGSIFAKGQASTTLNNYAFNPTYAAPEVIKNAEEANIPESQKEYARINVYHADLYSLGLVMLRCCGVNVKAHPKNDQHHDAALENLIKAALDNGYSGQLLDIVKKMCFYNPKQRISIQDLKEKVKDL